MGYESGTADIDQADLERLLSRRLLLRPSEAASVCGISRSQAYMLANGPWRAFSIRVGRSVRISVEGLRDWIQEQQSVQPHFGQKGPF